MTKRTHPESADDKASPIENVASGFGNMAGNAPPRSSDLKGHVERKCEVMDDEAHEKRAGQLDRSGRETNPRPERRGPLTKDEYFDVFIRNSRRHNTTGPSMEDDHRFGAGTGPILEVPRPWPFEMGVPRMIESDFGCRLRPYSDSPDAKGTQRDTERRNLERMLGRLAEIARERRPARSDPSLPEVDVAAHPEIPLRGFLEALTRSNDGDRSPADPAPPQHPPDRPPDRQDVWMSWPIPM